MRWLGWGVILSLVPFGALFVAILVIRRQVPGLDPIIGSGQLLVTCVALLGGGIRELSGMNTLNRARARDALHLASLIFVVLLSMTYGSLVGQLVSGQSLPDEWRASIVTGSLISLTISVIIGGISMAISHPGKAP